MDPIALRIMALFRIKFASPVQLPAIGVTST